MTQPSFVPITEADQVRPARRLQVPGPWHQDRPAELVGPQPLAGRGRGTPGPDQGYAMRLGHRFDHRLVLVGGEVAEDAVVGGALLGATRAALFGRAPTVYDLEWAFELFGFLFDAPAELVAHRRKAFATVAKHYPVQRALVDAIPAETLLLSAEQVVGRRDEWRQLLGLAGSADGAGGPDH